MRSTRLDLSLACTIMTLSVSGAAQADDPASASKSDDRQSGNASFYSHHLSGRRTASGERYDPKGLTAAHRTLPLGTKLRVTNPKNDRSVVVTVNDRGRLPKGRVVDVSSAAADALAMKKSGVTRVHTQVEPLARTRIVDPTGAARPGTETTAAVTAPQ